MPTSDLDQYRAMHADGKFRGRSLNKHVDAIAELVRRFGAKTLLDYGCGAGEQYTVDRCHEKWSIMPTLYDPATEHSVKPTGKFCGVICTDVAEHLPEPSIPGFLAEVFAYAEKFVFLSISTRPARKTLPDGRNCHLTVRPAEWWMSRIPDRIFSRVVFTD